MNALRRLWHHTTGRHTWQQLVTATCNRCGDNWWKGDPEDNPALYFPSKAAARKALVSDHEWMVERRLFRYLMLCEGCAAKHKCAHLGHDWATVYRYDPDAEDDLTQALACTRCDRFRPETAPPLGHPEDLELEFTREEDAYLGWLHEQLFPEEAM